MKRSALVRRTPLRSTPPAGWPAREERPRAPLVPIRRLAPAPAIFRPTPKAELVRSEPYRRLVAALPCWRCGIEGYSQAAHADEGKGDHIKACDLTCYPLCGARAGEPGCHWWVGTSGDMPRELRREIEPIAAAATKAALRDLAHTHRSIGPVLRAAGLEFP